MLEELEHTKSQALQESLRFNNERELSHHQRVELEANLWANKSEFLRNFRKNNEVLDVLVELRSKLEIAEATIEERKAQVDDMHNELETFKRDARETQSLLQVSFELINDVIEDYSRMLF